MPGSSCTTPGEATAAGGGDSANRLTRSVRFFAAAWWLLIRSRLRHLGNFLFEFGHALEQFGETPQGDDLPLRFAVRLRRVSKPFFAVRNVVHNPGLRGDRDLIPDFQVAADSDLPSKDNVVSDLRTAGDSN